MKQHKFERMDKGVKRTKLSNGKTIKARDEKGQAVSVLDPETRPEIIASAIQRYIHGESVQTLCAELNVSRGTIYNWMLGDLGPDNYNSLVTQALVAKINRADEMLETAADPLNMSRGREMARFARQDLERRRPNLYGQKQEVTHNLPNGPLLNIVLSSQPQPVVVTGDVHTQQPQPITDGTNT